MKVKALKLKDRDYGEQWSKEVENHWDYEDFLTSEGWRKDWISFDSALYNSGDDRVYLGITSFDADIAKAYNRKTGCFDDLGFGRIADPYDAKFHHSLVKREKDGCIYTAIALLHEPEQQWDAPGGAIIKYDPVKNEISKFCIPIPHVYIQAIALDEQRDLLYAQCFPPEYLITCNLETKEVKNLGLIGTGIGGMAQCENIVLDDEGCLWGPHCLTRAWQSGPGPDARRIFRVPAGSDRVDFLKTGLPKTDGSYGYERMDAIFNFHDGCLYATGGNGSIYRIDTKTGEAEYLFTPIKDRPSRLSGMVPAGNGCAYGVTGRAGKCELLKFDYLNSTYELLGEIRDNDISCWQVHDLVITGDGTIYACENDNPYRSSYLWEISGGIR